MIARLLGACLEVLAAAAAIYVAVHLIESIGMALLVIIAVLGGSVAVGMLGTFFVRQFWSNRW